MNVLVVGPPENVSETLRREVAGLGHALRHVRSGDEILPAVRRGEARLILLAGEHLTDASGPDIGYTAESLCRAIRREDASGYAYLVMLADSGPAERATEHWTDSPDDFLSPAATTGEVRRCLRRAERSLSVEARDLAMLALAKLAENRDDEVGTHVERVQQYSRVLAIELSTHPTLGSEVTPEFVRLLMQTSPLHDIGKVGIPDSVLLKPGRLNEAETSMMRAHTELGARTLSGALSRYPDAAYLRMARDVAVSHHERWDGTGYPRGLSKDQIPLSGRIVALADVYDALTSERPYKRAMSHEVARKLIVEESGQHFDPEIVAAFERVEPMFLTIRQRYSADDASWAQARLISQHAAAVAHAAAAQPRGCTVLVAEDDPAQRLLVVESLRTGRFKILEASNGSEALALIESERPGVIVADWDMPEMDGIGLCREVRAMDPAYTPQFIMLTVRNDKEHLLRAFEAGIDDFISKPFDRAELAARVRASVRSDEFREMLVLRHAQSNRLIEELSLLNQKFERLTITDELTGLYNRRYAMLRLEEHLATSIRYGKGLSVAVIDIDHFKAVNDTYGHLAGDHVLRGVADVLRGQVRTTDALCRIGGEEIMVILPSDSRQGDARTGDLLETTEEAMACAERCRAAVAERAFKYDGRDIRVTISIGVAVRGGEANEPSELIRRADAALYAAKRTGRNLCLAYRPAFDAPARPLASTNDKTGEMIAAELYGSEQHAADGNHGDIPPLTPGDPTYRAA